MDRMKTKNVIIVYAMCVLVAALALIFTAYYFLSSPVYHLSLANSAYNNSYYTLSKPSCFSSKILSENNITKACSAQFEIKNQSSSFPYSISLFYFAFTSHQDAMEYLQSMSSLFNTTPYNVGYGLYNITNERNITIYSSYIVNFLPTEFNRTFTLYGLQGSSVYGVSVLLDKNSSLSLSKEIALNLLYLHYKK